MKNIIRLFTFMLTVSIIFTACNKDTSLTEEVKNIDPTEQKILNFKEQMKSGDKSGETMSMDSAVWYIEAALNYTYCMYTPNDPEISDVFQDTLIYNLSSKSNDILFRLVIAAIAGIIFFSTIFVGYGQL